MSRQSAYETLLGIDALGLKRVSEQLNEAGVATDEDGLCLGSVLIEHWSDPCTELLRENGYQGGELRAAGHYFNHCGAIYALYDSERCNLEGAIKELHRAASRHVAV